MELFRVTTELISMTEIVKILEEQMEVKHRMDCVDSMDMSSQGSLKFNNWFQVPKHNLLGHKTVVNSLKKSAILMYNRSETLHIHKDQWVIQHQKWKKDHIVHQKHPIKIIWRMVLQHSGTRN